MLRAKSLFQLYKIEQKKLRFSSLHPKFAHGLSSDCYAKAKEVVGLLGEAFDAGLLDEEGQNFLDGAMMDLVHGPNKLGECARCFLCRNKLHIADTSKEVSILQCEGEKPDEKRLSNLECASSHVAMEGTTVESKIQQEGKKFRKDKKARLIHSHLYPKAILKRLAAAIPSQPSQKVFVTSQTTVQSPGELTRIMLCHRCEDTLSAYGESQFLPLFFDKIYDVTEPSKLNEAQSIKYDDWLYNFCIGLIFRNMFWYSGDYVNEYELHRLFSDCRNCLLSLQSCGQLNSDQAKPDIYLLITPLSGDAGDMQAGLMNRVLSGSCQSHVGTCKLDVDVFKAAHQVNAHFFLVHMACINVLVKFEPSKGVHVDTSFLVQWRQGLHEYNFPSAEERKEKIPPGLWAFLRVVAEKKEIAFYERRYLSQTKKEKDPEKLAYKVYGILQGSLSELQLRQEGAIPAANPKEPKQINLLPPQFHFQNPVSKILPENHHILLHHTFHQGQRKGFSVFLAVGQEQDTEYSIERPYIIFHKYSPGLDITTGFFISRQNLTALDYLSEGKMHTVLKNPDFLADVRAQMPDIMLFLLDQKGFLCLDSLLLRIETVP